MIRAGSLPLRGLFRQGQRPRCSEVHTQSSTVSTPPFAARPTLRRRVRSRPPSFRFGANPFPFPPPPTQVCEPSDAMKVRLELDISPSEAPRLETLVSAIKDFVAVLSTVSPDPCVPEIITTSVAHGNHFTSASPSSPPGSLSNSLSERSRADMPESPISDESAPGGSVSTSNTTSSATGSTGSIGLPVASERTASVAASVTDADTLSVPSISAAYNPTASTANSTDDADISDLLATLQTSASPFGDDDDLEEHTNNATSTSAFAYAVTQPIPATTTTSALTPTSTLTTAPTSTASTAQTSVSPTDPTPTSTTPNSKYPASSSSQPARRRRNGTAATRPKNTDPKRTRRKQPASTRRPSRKPNQTTIISAPNLSNSQQIFAAVAVEKITLKKAVFELRALTSPTSSTISRAEVIDAATAEIIDSTKVCNHPSRGLNVVRVLNMLGDDMLKSFKQQFVSLAIKQFIQPRAVDCDRAQFLGYSDGLSALVQENCITADAALKTIHRLLLAPVCWTAALTTLCKLAETCNGSLASRCTDAEIVDRVREKLVDLAKKKEYIYDITYLNGATGWQIPLPSTD